ncbi:hypothetical protein Ccrd_004118 [Cynara cardunculus var. scolymus]|uniref:Maintenance of Photosystem II under High light 2 C-terminal domain-containing protein n=1 Tax=Cynara cardunculus var. scolymus TaxID=59895 RepID=A0A103XN72_CYNCS|nr:hypothetical protein Ccrd_004118 [Cynara cardunculus var. scolymus]
MAAIFLANPSTFLPSSSTSMQKHIVKGTSVCKPVNKLPNYPPQVSKRSLSISLTSLFLLSSTGNPHGANAAILEADDDLELMEKVKKDRKKRIEKQTVLNSSSKDKDYLQDVIYKLSKIGQAIENNDLPSAGSVLGQTLDADWVKMANVALSKTPNAMTELQITEMFVSNKIHQKQTMLTERIGSTNTCYSIFISSQEGWASLTSTTGQPFSAAVAPPASTLVTGTESSIAVSSTTLVTSSGGGVSGFSSTSSLTSFAGLATSSIGGSSWFSHASSLTASPSSCLLLTPPLLLGLATSSVGGTSGISLFPSASSLGFSSSFSAFSASCISTSFSSGASSFSFLSFFEDDDFLGRFFTGSFSAGGGVDFTFSLILEDLRGVSPLPQSNSEILGPPGCDFRYCSSCFLFVISSPVGAVNTVSFFLGVPPFFSKHYT